MPTFCYSCTNAPTFAIPVLDADLGTGPYSAAMLQPFAVQRRIYERLFSPHFETCAWEVEMDVTGLRVVAVQDDLCFIGSN